MTSPLKAISPSGRYLSILTLYFCSNMVEESSRSLDNHTRIQDLNHPRLLINANICLRQAVIVAETCSAFFRHASGGFSDGVSNYLQLWPLTAQFRAPYLHQ